MVSHPHFAGPVRIAVTPLGDRPDDQVAQTIQLMRRYSSEDARTPTVQAAAARSLRQYPGADPVSAVFFFVKHQLRFLHDEQTAAALPHLGGTVIETLVRPVDILDSSGHGDCDDFSMLTAAMLTAIGVPAAFVTVAADPSAPDQYSHVYVAAYPAPGVRIPLDTSHGPRPGWETPSRFGKRREWPLHTEANFQ